jgi:hypothetical protein
MRAVLESLDPKIWRVRREALLPLWDGTAKRPSENTGRVSCELADERNMAQHPPASLHVRRSGRSDGPTPDMGCRLPEACRARTRSGTFASR